MNEHTTDSLVVSAYQALFQHTSDAVLVLDNTLTIRTVNPTMDQLATTDLQGTVLSDFLQSTFDLDTPLEDLNNIRLKRTQDDVSTYYEAKVHPLPERQGYIIILRDITEVVNLGADYSHFAHTISHDIKAPLSIAVSYTHMLQSDIEEGTEARYFVDEIFGATMRIINICNELVLLSDLEHLKVAESMPVDMAFVVNNAVRRFQHVTDSRTITIDIPEKIKFAKGNAPWVEEAIVDYLRYAMIDNPSSKAIEIHVIPDGDTIQFSIKHDGTEMPATTIEAMFSDTIDLKNIRAEGYGLGLNVAKRLLEHMDGSVNIVDGMLTFTIPVIKN